MTLRIGCGDPGGCGDDGRATLPPQPGRLGRLSITYPDYITCADVARVDRSTCARRTT